MGERCSTTYIGVLDPTSPKFSQLSLFWEWFLLCLNVDTRSWSLSLGDDSWTIIVRGGHLMDLP